MKLGTLLEIDVHLVHISSDICYHYCSTFWGTNCTN